MLPANVEEAAYMGVEMGELEIDEEGQVWRVAARRWSRWTGTTRSIPCKRRRAEKPSGDYLQVRVMIDLKRANALAHRLVWRHFNGPIPDGLTINHKDGHKVNNRPDNLELATYSEQAIHAREVLGKCGQKGEKNNNAKLSDANAELIRIRRENGEDLKSIARDFMISDKTVSKIALRQRWACIG